jgi:hypothetical protein
MSNFKLIEKFRPIFIFSKDEKYYPINKKFLKKNTEGYDDMRFNKEIYESLPYPKEPLYSHIVDENENEIAVAYILIFPYSERGFFGISGDIVSCVAVIDKKTKTLREIYFWNGGKEEFQTKTTRPVIYISANNHLFSASLGNNEKGIRWEPDTVEDFKLRKLEGRKLEGKNFNDFLNSYS